MHFQLDWIHVSSILLSSGGRLVRGSPLQNFWGGTAVVGDYNLLAASKKDDGGSCRTLFHFDESVACERNSTMQRRRQRRVVARSTLSVDATRKVTLGPTSRDGHSNSRKRGIHSTSSREAQNARALSAHSISIKCETIRTIVVALATRTKWTTLEIRGKQLGRFHHHRLTFSKEKE